MGLEGQAMPGGHASRPVASFLILVLAGCVARVPGLGWLGVLVARGVSAAALVGLIAWLATRLRDRPGLGRGTESLRQRAERLRGIALRLVDDQEDERRGLAHELHDEVGQALAAVAMSLQLQKATCGPESESKVDASLRIVRDAIGRVRGLALDLRPAMLDDLGLAATLRWLVRSRCEPAGLAGHCRAESSGPPLPTGVATACYRVAQEALTDVIRYGRARNVWVELRREPDGVRLVVRDDGAGLVPEDGRLRAAEGPVGSRERAELLGGSVEIESEPGRGTTVRAWLPIGATTGEGGPGPP